MVDPRITKLPRVMQMIQEDATKDAMAIDGKPFTGATLGEEIGKLNASIVAIAKAVELLAIEVME